MIRRSNLVFTICIMLPSSQHFELMNTFVFTKKRPPDFFENIIASRVSDRREDLSVTRTIVPCF